MSIVTNSYGSNIYPVFSSFYIITYGGVTDISYPSLLIFSIKTPKWRSPLPCIVTVDPFTFDFSTFKLTSSWLSLSILSLIYATVNLSPSKPFKGESFKVTVRLSIGGSIGTDSITLFFSSELTIFPTVEF